MWCALFTRTGGQTQITSRRKRGEEEEEGAEERIPVSSSRTLIPESDESLPSSLRPVTLALFFHTSSQSISRLVHLRPRGIPFSSASPANHGPRSLFSCRSFRPSGKCLPLFSPAFSACRECGRTSFLFSQPLLCPFACQTFCLFLPENWKGRRRRIRSPFPSRIWAKTHKRTFVPGLVFCVPTPIIRQHIKTRDS